MKKMINTTSNSTTSNNSSNGNNGSDGTLKGEELELNQVYKKDYTQVIQKQQEIGDMLKIMLKQCG